LIENAKFEEVNGNSPRARKIYEQLDTEIAPGLVKAQLARINFEKREKNLDKARELYSNAFNQALKKNNSLAVTVIATQYARFLSSKCLDHNRAMLVFDQAVSNKACASKVLYLQYVNLARSNNDSTNQVKSIFEKAVAHLNEIEDHSNKQYQDLRDLCFYFITYLEEEAASSE